MGSVRARPQCSAASGVPSGGRVVPHIGSQDRVGPSWFRDPTQSRSFATVVSHQCAVDLERIREHRLNSSIGLVDHGGRPDCEGHRGWKLFALVPMMLLHRPRGTGSVGRSELVHRADKFAAGRWTELVVEATQHQVSHIPRRERTEEADRQHRGKAAQACVQRGQVSRARQELTGAQLAPKDESTLNELRNRRPHEQLREKGFSQRHRCSWTVRCLRKA